MELRSSRAMPTPSVESMIATEPVHFTQVGQIPKPVGYYSYCAANKRSIAWISSP